MRFFTKTIHAWLDYPLALALVSLPFLFGLGGSHPLARYISPVVGVRCRTGKAVLARDPA